MASFSVFLLRLTYEQKPVHKPKAYKLLLVLLLILILLSAYIYEYVINYLRAEFRFGLK